MGTKFINEVKLCGNLCRDPETRAAGSSTVTKATIAINRKYDKGGEKIEEVTFVDVEAWSATAKLLAEYHKGEGVSVEGRLKLDQWEDKETGKKQSKLKVTAFVIAPPVEWESDGKGPHKPSGKSAAPKVAAKGAAIDEDSIPF